MRRSLIVTIRFDSNKEWYYDKIMQKDAVMGCKIKHGAFYKWRFLPVFL